MTTETGTDPETGAEPATRPDVRFVYAPELASWKLAEGHPFKPVRLELTRTLLRDAGTLNDAHELAPRAFDDRALERVHDPAFVAAVRRASRGSPGPDAYTFGLGTGDTPIFEGMHASVRAVCAATVTAVETVASGDARRAVSFAGGLHHAHRARASGFCVYNDLALGIEHAVEQHAMRVAYVDLDAHHGDGVQDFFWRRGDVMTVSLHESGRYLFPGTGHAFEIGEGEGEGASVNAPLEPFTDDDGFLEVFDAVVPAALRAFRPDLIVLQAGADMHRNDPLAHLALGLAGQRASYRRMVDLADELCGGRIVATGGGGYDPFRTVPRAWGWLWSAFTGTELPDPLPEAWRERWRERAEVPLPRHPLDRDPDAEGDRWTPPPEARRDVATAANRAVARRLLDQLRPIWERWHG